MELTQLIAHEVGRRTHPRLVEALPDACAQPVRRHSRWVTALRGRLSR